MQENDKAHLLKRWKDFNDQEIYLIEELANSNTYEKRKAFKKFLKGTRKMKNLIERELIK
jgi:hypothetical protein